jgi:DNA-directed RNA polymerase specialized sigma subunit
LTEYRNTLRSFLRSLGQREGNEQHNPEGQFRKKQACSLLLEACETELTVRQALIVRLRYSDGLAWVAIATQLQVSDAAVIQAHDRAIAALRKHFASRGIQSL